MKEKDDDFELGKLLNFKDLDDDKLKIFIKLLSDDCSSTFQVISNVLEDNYLFVELLDIFAGSKIQFPTRKKLYKLLEKTYIYSFVKKSKISKTFVSIISDIISFNCSSSIFEVGIYDSLISDIISNLSISGIIAKLPQVP